MNYKLNNDVPCAYITKEKQRVKQFGQSVYLKDGSEFEVELYNPSRKNVLSKIKINGEFINGGGIILRPGERVFLERYIDVPNKFKFETYAVDSSNDTMNAIANNGDVEILFYEEQNDIEVRLNTFTTYPTYINNNLTAPIGNNFYTSQSNMDITLTSTNGTLSFSDNIRSNKFEQQPRSRSFAKKSKSIETGRVEKGSESDQTFKTVNKNFNIWTVSTSVWKILPESQKPLEKKDLIERCSRCLTKVKKSSWKFCPECGNEIKRIKTEINYIEAIYVDHNGKKYMMQDYKMGLDKFFELHKNKLIYIKSSSIGNDTIRAVVID